MNKTINSRKPATPDNPKASAELRCVELLADLDAQYKRFNAVRHTSIWGGSFEREHGAAMDIKPIINKMFDTLMKLMEARSASVALNKLAPESFFGLTVGQPATLSENDCFGSTSNVVVLKIHNGGNVIVQDGNTKREVSASNLRPSGDNPKGTT